MNLLLNSIPKSGTNLLQKFFLLVSIPYSHKSIAASSIFGRYGRIKSILRRPRPNEVPVQIGLEVPNVVSPTWLCRYLRNARGYVSGHAAYSAHLYTILQNENYKVIQIVRHPCAVLVSWANYIVEPDYWWASAYREMNRKSFAERLQLLIRGGYLGNHYYAGFKEILLRTSGWIEDKRAFILRFEDLVGSQGGGDDDLQRETINGLLEFIEVEGSNRCVDMIMQDLYGGTPTFRKGKIASWKDSITPDVEPLIHELFESCSYLKKLNYFIP
jgi:hypothetical protein